MYSTDKPEEWVFDCDIPNERDKLVFDITNDRNGDLHDVAQQNILVFVNETDGREQASIHARRDLFSHVHYLLGPGESESDLSFPYGEWVRFRSPADTHTKKRFLLTFVYYYRFYRLS